MLGLGASYIRDLAVHGMSKVMEVRWFLQQMKRQMGNEKDAFHALPMWYDVRALMPTQKGEHFTKDIFKLIFLYGNRCVLVPISPKFVPKYPHQTMNQHCPTPTHYVKQWGSSCALSHGLRPCTRDLTSCLWHHKQALVYMQYTSICGVWSQSVKVNVTCVASLRRYQVCLFK